MNNNSSIKGTSFLIVKKFRPGKLENWESEVGSNFKPAGAEIVREGIDSNYQFLRSFLNRKKNLRLREAE